MGRNYVTRWFEIAAGCILLAGCNQPEPDPAPSPAAPSTQDIAGTYEAALPDGSRVRHTLGADGSYSEEDGEGNPIEIGTWRLNGDQICYDPEGSEPESCFETGPSDDVAKVDKSVIGKATELPEGPEGN